MFTFKSESDPFLTNILAVEIMKAEKMIIKLF